MAITINSEPQELSPASNPLLFEFTSDQTAETAFSFIIELTVNGTVHSFHQTFVESGTVGKFNASAILRTIVSSELNPGSALGVSLSNSVASYSIRVAEQYGEPATNQGVWVSSSTLRTMNGALRHSDWINYDSLDYDFAITSPCEFMTTFPRSQKYFCGINESMFLTMGSSSPFNSELAVRLYDVTDTLISSDLTPSITNGYMLLTNVSPSSIVTHTSINSSDFDSCYYYTVEVFFSGANTELFKIYIDNECTQYTSRRLHWLNKLGGWESYSFIKYSEESSNIKYSKYQRDSGQWSSSNAYEYNRVNGSTFSGTKTATDMMKINSDWIKEEKHNWLMPSLIESPLVYLEVEQGVFEPVTVTTKKYKQKQRIKEGLIQEEIQIERTYQYVSQLG